MDVIALYSQTTLVAKLVIFTLLAFSFYSWAIIIAKFFFLKAVKKENNLVKRIIFKARTIKDMEAIARRYSNSSFSRIFRNVYDAIRNKRIGTMESLERALVQELTDEIKRLESYVSFLAITASSAPFIGLFGTVWGIMNAFHQIGLKKTASLVAVAPGIAEALITTAAGLFAAVPAVIFYNYFSAKIKDLAQEAENFSNEILIMAERLSKDAKEENL